MATEVVSSIGTGGDYTTVAAWIAACPSNLVTADQVWIGELKNQEFVSANTLTGITTDATRYVELRCEAGASFLDNANLQTNALRYNASNGAGISSDSPYYAAISVNSNMKVRLVGLQLNATFGANAFFAGAGQTAQIERCILEAARTSDGGAGTIVLLGSNSYCANSLIVTRQTTRTIVGTAYGPGLYNCTLVAVNGTAPYATQDFYGAPTLKNCLLMGVTAVTSGGTPTYTTCLTNVASPPSGCTTAAFSTSSGVLFENITSGTHDLRIKSGSAAIDAGTTDATYGTPSINGTARTSGQYDIGAWEFAGGGGGGSATGAAAHYYRQMQ